MNTIADDVSRDYYAELESRNATLVVAPKGEPLYSERAFHISLCDEGGGEFVTLKTSSMTEDVKIYPAEWDELRQSIGSMIEACRS